MKKRSSIAIVPENNNEKFTDNCVNGKTEILSETRVAHSCGFRPSMNYGEEGKTFFYIRVAINGTDPVRYCWFREWL